MVKAFTDLVDDREILAIHASRLTEREIENIRNFGLDATSGELVTKKLAQARDDNALTEDEYQHLLDVATSSLEPDEFRANQICLSIGEFDYDRDKSQLYHFWRTWGGEIINMNVREVELMKKLRSLGKSVNVKIHIPDFVEAGIAENVFLGSLKAFYGESELIGLHIPSSKTRNFRFVGIECITNSLE